MNTNLFNSRSPANPSLRYRRLYRDRGGRPSLTGCSSLDTADSMHPPIVCRRISFQRRRTIWYRWTSRCCRSNRRVITQLGPDLIFSAFTLKAFCPFNPTERTAGARRHELPSGGSTGCHHRIDIPIPVQDDGTLALPLIEPLQVNGRPSNSVRGKNSRNLHRERYLRERKRGRFVTIIKNESLRCDRRP